MRKIKFRGKDKADTWVYGGLTQSVTDKGTEYFIVQNDFSFISVDPDTVGQYTGLEDRNGKEIYEGDVLIGDGTIKFLVQYSEPKHSFCMTSIEDMNALPDFDSSFMIRNVWWERYRKTIIGNIYDNPELVKQKDNDNETEK